MHISTGGPADSTGIPPGLQSNDAPAPHFIINPAAGRVRRLWPLALPALRRRFPWLTYTEASDVHELRYLARKFARAQDATASHPWLVGVGGDGTHHHIVGALAEAGLTDRCRYAPLPLGSGNDWCRTLQVPRHLIAWMDCLAAGRTLRHRIGLLRYDGQQRHFINVAGLAYDAEVVRRLESSGRAKHRWVYPLLTLNYLRDFRPPPLRLAYGEQRIEDRFHTINLGIGRYNGGGMRLVPQANPTADRLALTYATAMPLGRILANSWRFYTSSIGRVPGVTTTNARQVSIAGHTGLEADGEWLGRRERVTAELIIPPVRVLTGKS